MTANLAEHFSVRGPEAEFLDLICADEELLRAEFDASHPPFLEPAAGWDVRPPAAGEGKRSTLKPSIRSRTLRRFGRVPGSVPLREPGVVRPEGNATARREACPAKQWAERVLNSGEETETTWPSNRWEQPTQPGCTWTGRQT
jgi:hypothetical protein